MGFYWKTAGAVALAAATIGTAGALATTSAAAHEFRATETGQIVDEGITEQRFATTEGGSEVVCQRQIGKGTLLAIATAIIDLIDEYSECTAFGFVGAKVSEVEYEMNANGTIAILNTVTLTVEGVCEVTIAPQTLGSVTYANSGGELEVDLALKGIVSKSNNTFLCPAGTNGTYIGKKRVKAPATLEWV